MKILKQYPKPKTRDEALGYILETAGKLGIQITDEEMADIAALNRNEKHDWY